MSDIFLLLGGNEEGTGRAFDKATGMLSATVGVVVSLSSRYTSPPWGFEHPHWFLNQVVRMQTKLSPRELLLTTQAIEKQLGRASKTMDHYEGRLIDIDILFVDGRIINFSELTVPHPRLHLRRFTLLPLNELSPGLVHPQLNKTVEELLRVCPDRSEVRKVDQSFEP
ncbi:MAG: 2-amino-4-hydroxy-6-hydroxymethyldihydropteridine diphosphokinase [Marinilabilia sp.]